MEDAAEFIKDTVNQWLAGADYEKCCNPFWSGDFVDFFKDFAGLLMCPADGLTEGFVSELFDVLLPPIANAIVKPIDDVVDKMNNGLGIIEDVFDTLDGIRDIARLSMGNDVPDPSCDLNVDGINIERNWHNFNPPSVWSLPKFQVDLDGTFDASEVFDAIGKACADAVGEFSENTDCCYAVTLDQKGSVPNAWNNQHCDYNTAPDCHSGMDCIVFKAGDKRCTNGLAGSPCAVHNDCKNRPADKWPCVPEGIGLGSYCRDGNPGE